MELDKVPSPYILMLLVAVLAVISFFLGWLFAYLKKRPFKHSDDGSDMDVPIVV